MKVSLNRSLRSWIHLYFCFNKFFKTPHQRLEHRRRRLWKFWAKRGTFHEWSALTRKCGRFVFFEELVPRKAENLNIGVMTSQFTVQLFTVSQKFSFLFPLINILLYYLGNTRELSVTLVILLLMLQAE